MSRLIVHSVSISVDGYGAGAGQDLDHPLGVGGEVLHDWLLTTRTWQRMHGLDGGETGPDDDVASGGGEHLLQGIDFPALGYECAGHKPGDLAAAHVVIRKTR